jgi:DDE superfamily endonuclease
MVSLYGYISPPRKDCMDIGFKYGKFSCSQKSKFGLNCQAVCDICGMIVDISIVYPGSTSDYHAFEGTSLFHQLENAGLLAPGLCILGDNAYLNMPYMATPYVAATGEAKDAYKQLLSFTAVDMHRMRLWNVDT